MMTAATVLQHLADRRTNWCDRKHKVAGCRLVNVKWRLKRF